MSSSTSAPTADTREIISVIAAGAALLLVVHTLGRFIFTPMLPYLIDDGVVTAQQGAAMATWNYLGYFVGAMLAIRWYRVSHIRRILPIAMIVHVVTTLLQTQISDVVALDVIRGINGVANGAVFVQAPAFILEWLVLRNRARLSGLTYLGVGVGLLVSSMLVSATGSWLSGPSLWWPAAIVSIPLAVWGWHRLSRLEVPVRPEKPDGSLPQKGSLLDRASIPLFLQYAGAGLGYILPMTFLPLLAKLQLDPGNWLVDGSWLLVALGTIPSAWLWNTLGARLGDVKAIRINFAVQLFGVLAAVIWGGPVGIALCALLVGGTFLGTVLLTQRLARALHPHQGPRLSAAMVALYALAQMIGPWLAEQWLNHGGTLESAFWIGVGALAWGLAFAFFVPRPEDWHRRPA
ncbi:putative MFS family arabinose efflux permease [Tamilnaduibacter salinus]|uniref:Putative MFS family arabinose efflux permease n=1 Tax=Tamilnaduibacter salinus TaxID=1484056 RepID=A0A2U1CY43_9GAMM|nr:YbfB/YjiJ family MFS transporter [Tamilnaduibacter salinus]PVY77421.1 putative MFS family arabinose efflux permease [Tamilnaduibacter salinus]